MCNKPFKKLLFLSCIMALSACQPHFDQDAANQFQSLSKNQQASYWQAKKTQTEAVRLEQKGIMVYQVGDEYRIIIPAGIVFINANTPALTNQAHDVFDTLVALLNNQKTPSVHVLAYVNPGTSPQRDYALSEAWAEVFAENLRDDGLATALVTSTGMGRCDNVGSGYNVSQRIELRYRIIHED